MDENLMDGITVAELETLTKGFKVDSNGCWLWIMALDLKGYSAVWFRNRTRRGHRIFYQGIRGPIPATLECDHLCKNRACINPYHIELVTHLVNLSRRKKRVKCLKGLHDITNPENVRIAPRSGSRLCIACNKMYKLKQKSLKEAQ